MECFPQIPRLDHAKPAIDGYCGAFIYNLANRVTITVEATKNENAAISF